MMNRTDKKAVLETLKSAARFLWFGILGLVATVLATLATGGAVTNVTIHLGTLDVNLGVVILAAIGFIAKAIDQYVHKNDNIEANGIAPPFLQQ